MVRLARRWRLGVGIYRIRKRVTSESRRWGNWQRGWPVRLGLADLGFESHRRRISFTPTTMNKIARTEEFKDRTVERSKANPKTSAFKMLKKSWHR